MKKLLILLLLSLTGCSTVPKRSYTMGDYFWAKCYIQFFDDADKIIYEKGYCFNVKDLNDASEAMNRMFLKAPVICAGPYRECESQR